MTQQTNDLIKTCVGREELYCGPVYQLWMDELMLPNGARIKREHLHHPHSVAILVLDDHERCGMVRQYRHVIGETILEVPAGKLDKGESETPLDAAKRELQEETGCTAGSWTSLGIIYPTPGVVDETIHLFLAKDLSMGQQHLEAYEFLTVQWMDIPKLREMIVRGEINDSKTICILSRAYFMGFLG